MSERAWLRDQPRFVRLDLSLKEAEALGNLLHNALRDGAFEGDDKVAISSIRERIWSSEPFGRDPYPGDALIGALCRLVEDRLVGAAPTYRFGHLHSFDATFGALQEALAVDGQPAAKAKRPEEFEAHLRLLMQDRWLIAPLQRDTQLPAIYKFTAQIK